MRETRTELRSRLNAAERNEQQARDSLAESQRAYELARQKAAELRTALKQAKEAQIHVTDHAIVRYLERVKGVDTAAIKAEIVNGKLRDFVDKLGNGTFPIEGGRARVKDRVVVTVLSPKQGSQ